MKAVGAHITGRVQGVAFRNWTKVEAQARGLSGWVRNEPDGSVRAVLAGPAAAVDEMLRAFEAGPPAAIVTGVAIEAAEPPGDTGFAILR